MEKKPSFASNSNWADDVEAEEAELGQAPLPVDEILRERPSYAMSPRSGGGGGGGGHGYSPRAGPMMTPLPDHPPFKAYIGNVPYDIDEEVVDHFFRGLKISDIMVTRHRDTGRAKGCFVEFASQQDLKNALTMNGADLLRRAVTIQVAEPKHGGGGGGGRGGGRERDSFFGGGGGGGGGRGGDRRGIGGGGGGGYSRFDEDRGDSGGRWNQVRDVPLVEPSSPRERPRLILQPRRATEDAGDAAGGDGGAKPNPFGGARPANTAAKLQELEEKDRQRKADAAAARAAAKAAVEGGARETKGDGAAEGESPAVEQSRERTEPHRPPPGLSQAPGAGAGRGRGDRRDRERGGGDRRGGSGRGGQRERGSGGEPGGLSHHRQGDSGRGGRGGRGGGRGGGVRGEKTEKDAAAAPPPPRIVAAPGEDAVPKTKVSNPFDLLGDE
ncbi:hypothetical protein Ndes2526B_g01447 [Nannochloris sp. 'desiccata']|nr:hypothetical protein KSW81_004232 [Chlorella desiccata (nom. nud.)]KAH7624188.1 putative Eukaryotic translation initiation factor 4H [Chlorella desiccata (nom. nud.)]